jgi:hypothetical protein
MKNFSICCALILSALILLRQEASAQTSTTEPTVAPTTANTSVQKTEPVEGGFQRVAPPPISETRQFSKPSSKGKSSKKKDEWMKEMPPEQQFLLQSQLRKAEKAKVDKVETKSTTQSTKGISTVRTTTKTGGASAKSKKKPRQF